MKSGKLGEIAFIACVVIAILAGIFTANVNPTLGVILIVLGLIVGFLNVSEKETTPFLVAAVALIVAGTGSFSQITIAGIGAKVDNILRYVGVFVVPAAVIVSLKAVYGLASNK